MQVPILTDLVLIFALSLPVLYICHRLNIPTVVAFLLTGMLIGPSGFDLIQSRDEVDILAEVGVVLLLFTIGIEFSLENLLRIKRTVLIGGALTVVLDRNRDDFLLYRRLVRRHRSLHSSDFSLRTAVRRSC